MNIQEIRCDHRIWRPWPDPRKDLVVEHEIADTLGYSIVHDCEQVKVMQKGLKRIFSLKNHAPPLPL